MYQDSRKPFPGQEPPATARADYTAARAAQAAAALVWSGAGRGSRLPDVTDSATIPLEVPEPAYILICAELVRIAIALCFGLVLRIWLILFQLARETNHTGFTRAEIEAALRRYHVNFSTRNLTRWLHSGAADKLFWTYDPRTAKYYHRGYVGLSETLVNQCIETDQLPLVATNYPGQRRPVYLNVASNSLLQFESNCFEAWIGSRANLTIARETQAMLWNRSLSVLLSWGRANTAIQKISNYIFCDETHYDAIPRQADGSWRPDVRRTVLNHRDVIAWQLPNTYTAPNIQQHTHKGQLRRALFRLRKIVEAKQAAGNSEQGSGHSATPGGSNPFAQRYFQTNRGARDSAKRHGERARYVFKGLWNDRYGYFEYTPSGVEQFEYWQCRRVFRRHQCVSFTKRVRKIVVLKGVTVHPF